MKRYSLLVACCLYSDIAALSPGFPDDHPWFTGPLLAPSARVLGKGHINFQPYVFGVVITGRYNSDWDAEKIPTFYQVTPQLVLKAGISEKINVSCIFESIFNSTQGHSSAGFGDMAFGIEYEILNAKQGCGIPIKFSIQEVFPTGKFDGIDPLLLGTDVAGLGTYTTVLGLTFGKLHHFCDAHYINVRFNTSVALPVPVQVQGASVFGGDCSTSGKVFPGTSLFFTGAFEYSLTENWAVALDLTGQFSGRTRFKGFSRIPVGPPSSALFTAAPAIEYNFSKSIGIIAGAWFSLAGRNASRFVSAVAAINLYH